MNEHTTFNKEEAEQQTRQVGAAINQFLNPDGEKNIGFILLMFAFNDVGRCNYISNSSREDAVLAILEYVKHLKGEDYPDSFNNFCDIAKNILRETLEGDPMIPEDVAQLALEVFEVKLESFFKRAEALS